MIDDFFDVIIVGSGAAGLRASISCTQHSMKTLVVGLDKGATIYSTADVNISNEKLSDSIIIDSFGIANTEKASLLQKHATTCVEELITWGAKSYRYLNKETILMSGNLIHKTLYKTAKNKGASFLSNWTVYDLIFTENRVSGILICNGQGLTKKIYSKSVILATGGYHNIFKYNTANNNTSNKPISHAWALKVGAELTDMEMINYCPSGFRHNDNSISILPYILSHITSVHWKNVELKKIFSQRKNKNYNSEWDKLLLFLLATNQKQKSINNIVELFKVKPKSFDIIKLFYLGFKFKIIKNIKDVNLAIGLIKRKTIMVGLYPHYSSGGILTDKNGKTSVAGLLACGETAGGTFGAFRTISSITDCLVSGMITGLTAAKECSNIKLENIIKKEELTRKDISFDNDKINEILNKIIENALTIQRKQELLENGISEIQKLKNDIGIDIFSNIHPNSKYIFDRILIIEAILKSAALRKDSRGFHIRSEDLSINSDFNGNTIVQTQNETINVMFKKNKKKLGKENLSIFSFVTEQFTNF